MILPERKNTPRDPSAIYQAACLTLCSPALHIKLISRCKSFITFRAVVYSQSVFRISRTPIFSSSLPSREFSPFSPLFELPCLRHVQLSHDRRASAKASLLIIPHALFFPYGPCDVTCWRSVLCNPHRSRSVRWYAYGSHPPCSPRRVPSLDDALTSSLDSLLRMSVSVTLLRDEQRVVFEGVMKHSMYRNTLRSYALFSEPRVSPWAFLYTLARPPGHPDRTLCTDDSDSP